MVSGWVSLVVDVDTQGFILDFELGGGGGEQDGSRVVVACESMHAY